ncbi:hypothetical protein [Corynebacterium sp. UBA2622]|uniref:hypothetical protein n=1 Tax=Corynebacterium sp. UBA2622 TaxID=1946393 RepID=UPI0025BA0143|nr:hypothetical protein [Corynebacterium sp. UBA2622]
MGDFTALTGRLDAAAPLLRERFLTTLISEFPAARGFFPESSTAVPRSLVDALSWLLRNTDPDTPDGPMFPEVVRRLHAAALDLRRFGFPPEAYPTFAEVAGRVLADTVPAPADEMGRATWVINAAAAEMAREAAAADLAGIPAATAARVVSVDGRGPGGRVKVVRLEASMPLGYRPGQCVPVMHVDRRGEWTTLAPALPSNPYGQLEFHVTDELPAGVGDYVTLGAARGPVVACGEGDQLVIVAAGTGTAAAKALVFGFLEQEARPRVHLVLLPGGAGSVDAGYDTEVFGALAHLHPWLRVTQAESPEVLALDLVGGRRVAVCGPSKSVGTLAHSLRGSGAAEVIELASDAPADWG